MSGPITAGAASLLASLLGAVGLARWAAVPARRAAVARSVWPLAPGAVVLQSFGWCPVCSMDLPGTVHGDAYLCPQGHLITGGAA